MTFKKNNFVAALLFLTILFALKFIMSDLNITISPFLWRKKTIFALLWLSNLSYLLPFAIYLSVFVLGISLVMASTGFVCLLLIYVRYFSFK